MPKKTPSYQLNQWDPEDSFLRTDFNEDNAKLDAAIAAKPNLAFGTYTGDGQESQTISLGYTPKALFTCARDGQTGWNGRTAGGLVAPGHPVKDWQGISVVEIVEGGFTVSGSNSANSWQANVKDRVYHYLAVF